MFSIRPAAGTLAVLLVAGSAVSAGAQDGLVSIDYDTLNTAIIEDQIIPGHEGFVAATEALETALAGYCGGADGDLAAVEGAFHDAYDAWMAVSWINFGPQSLFMRPVRVHFWPDTRNALGRQLSELLSEPRADILDPEILADTSVALQGLPALERLIFEVEGFEAGGYTCDLAQAIAVNVNTIGRDLAAAWSDPDERAASLPTGQDLTNAIFQAVYEHLEMVLFRKLAPALGETIEEARPRLAENWRSERAIANIVANLEAMMGVIENGDGIGFADMLRSPVGARSLADSIANGMAAALDQARALEDQRLADIVTDPALREQLIDMGADANRARRLWADAAGPALNLNLGFNAQDGD